MPIVNNLTQCNNALANIKNKSNRHILTPCHRPTEVMENLWVCKETQLKGLLTCVKIDVIVPLYKIDGDIWTIWDGDIMYLPISDYNVLPSDIEKRYVKKIAETIKLGKSTCIFCMGGHGRTGYIASLVMHELGFEGNPIKFLRDLYCSNVVETTAQVNAIGKYIGMPDISKETPSSLTYSYSSKNTTTTNIYLTDSLDDISPYEYINEECGDCLHFNQAIMCPDHGSVLETSCACSKFMKYKGGKQVTPCCGNCVSWERNAAISTKGICYANRQNKYSETHYGDTCEEFYNM